MKLKHILTTAAVALGISLTPPAQKAIDGVKEEVTRILKTEEEKVSEVVASIQPTEADIQKSREYYNTRTDVSLTPEERESLILAHAKLTRAAQRLQDGSLSFEQFYDTIVVSNERIITDKNTKLQTEFSGYNRNASVGATTIEFWTSPGFPNTILEDYTISQVELKGGELTVVVSGNAYETIATGEAEKQQIDANLAPKNGKHPESKTLTLRLVLK